MHHNHFIHKNDVLRVVAHVVAHFEQLPPQTQNKQFVFNRLASEQLKLLTFEQLQNKPLIYKANKLLICPLKKQREQLVFIYIYQPLIVGEEVYTFNNKDIYPYIFPPWVGEYMDRYLSWHAHLFTKIIKGKYHGSLPDKISITKQRG